MVNTVIVTLRAKQFCQDFELPADVALQVLYPRLLVVLQNISQQFSGYRGIILELDGAGLLDKRATLIDYGIRTGFYLDIVKEEKYDGFGQG